jgi:hypothetical protein
LPGALYSKKHTANIIIAVRRSTKRTANIVGPFLFFHFQVWYLFLRDAEKYKSRILIFVVRRALKRTTIIFDCRALYMRTANFRPPR